jgi:nucleotidyltransferase/DNA polymerase involved in DNA repair
VYNERVKSELTQIPGIGKSIADDLSRIGITRIAQLKGKNPEKLYKKQCETDKAKIDRCLLYVYRGAVYYASTPEHKRDPRLLKWWNWSDENLKKYIE